METSSQPIISTVILIGVGVGEARIAVGGTDVGLEEMEGTVGGEEAGVGIT
jgi:hypothetical protein